MSVRRSLLVLTLLIFALPAAIFALRANRPQEEAAADIQTYVVERGDVDLTVSAIGTVQADRAVRVGFSTPGRIVELAVSPGAAVAEGDLIARVANDPQRLAVEQAALALELATIQRDRLLAGPTEAQIAAAEAAVNSAMGAVSSIQNAVSDDDLRAAELAYARAQQAVANAQHARAFGNGTPEQVALLDAQIGEATFNAEIARLNLESLQNGSSAQLNAAYARVTQAQRELDRLLAGATDADISRADAAIAQAQIALDRAQMALDKTELRAPFDGIVAAVNAEVGALVAPGLAVVEIADVTPLRLVVQVDEIDVRQISDGLPARVTLDALSDVDLAAVLESIALVPTNEDGIVSYDVSVRLDDADPRVRVGMTAEASIIVEAQRGVLVVPNSYIRLDRAANRAYVNVVRADGTLEEIPVTLGLQGQDRSQILAGLSEGDVIGVDLSADPIGLFGG